MGSIVFTAFPTLALNTACRTTGEATYVVRSEGRPCRDACESLLGRGARGSWQTSGVMECVEALEVDPTTPTGGGAEPGAPVEADGLSTPVAVCRMRTQYTGGIGRRPEGLSLHDASGASVAGVYFARVEQLERAAVIAFERLADELERLEAPRSLVETTRRGVVQERRHARIAARWRARFGGAPSVIDCAPARPDRSLLELARENAAEGCVHETWGAVLAAAQASLVDEPVLGGDLASIACDEAAHAALSLRIDAWARSRLDATSRRALDEARRDAVRELAHAVLDAPSNLGVVGVPDRRGQARLFQEACARLGWAA